MDAVTKSAEERLLEEGYEDVLIFKNYSYDDALIGVTEDNRAVYDYDKMIEWVMKLEGFTVEEAVDWLDFNIISFLPRYDTKGPIIVHTLRTT